MTKRTLRTLPEEVTTVLALPECWIKEDGEYRHLKNSVRDKKLPRIEIQYKELLEEMKIPYRIIKIKAEEFCEYWSPSSLEEYESTGPLYENVEGKYKYAHRFYTGKIQSQITVKTAKETEEEVLMRKQEFKDKSEMKKYFKEVRELVHGKQAVGAEIPTMSIDMAERISDAEIKVLPVKYANGWKSDYFAIFNLAEIEGREGRNIQMEVPEGKEGLFIGSGQWQVKEWAQMPWARRLHIGKIWIVGI